MKRPARSGLPLLSLLLMQLGAACVDESRVGRTPPPDPNVGPPGSTATDRTLDAAADAGPARSTATDGSLDSAVEAGAALTREQRFHAALDGVDRRCEQDTDCALVVSDVGCTRCRILVASRPRGVETFDTLIADLRQHCPAGETHDSADVLCRGDGYAAACRTGRCEQVVNPCSSGCTLQGDGRCVGPQGVVCEHCPAEARGPCRVLGQHCRYGVCSGVGVCAIDREGYYGEPDAQVWTPHILDC